MRGIGNRPKVPWARVFPAAPPDAIDLLDRMLRFDPEKRISVAEALAHPYLSVFHDPDDEPVAEHAFDFEFERQSLSNGQVKELIRKEVFASNLMGSP
jgi:serine/threonine protein kinase